MSEGESIWDDGVNKQDILKGYSQANAEKVKNGG